MHFHLSEWVLHLLLAQPPKLCFQVDWVEIQIMGIFLPGGGGGVIGSDIIIFAFFQRTQKSTGYLGITCVQCYWFYSFLTELTFLLGILNIFNFISPNTFIFSSLKVSCFHVSFLSSSYDIFFSCFSKYSHSCLNMACLFFCS